MFSGKDNFWFRSPGTPVAGWGGRAGSLAVGVLFLGTLLLAFGGCATTVYDAAHLPPALVAPRTEDLERIDWSQLASQGTRADLIEPGDVLDVTIITDYAEQPTTEVPVRVLEDGTGKVPLVGHIPLAGLELEEAEQAIAAEAMARQVFRNPHVIVTWKRRCTNQVRVVGAVEEQGVYELRRGDSSLVAALVAAGGLAEDAGPEIEIRRLGGSRPRTLPWLRQPQGVVTASAVEPIAPLGTDAGGPEILRVNLIQASQEGGVHCDLQDGDLVWVSRRPPRRIYVTGLVHQAGEYEMPPNEDLYLLQALAMAGSRTMQTADSVLILRQVPGREEPVRIQVSVAEAKANPAANLRLAPGDVISVEETPVTFVLDTLKNFLRVGLSLSSALPLF